MEGRKEKGKRKGEEKRERKGEGKEEGGKRELVMKRKKWGGGRSGIRKWEKL